MNHVNSRTNPNDPEDTNLEENDWIEKIPQLKAVSEQFWLSRLFKDEKIEKEFKKQHFIDIQNQMKVFFFAFSIISLTHIIFNTVKLIRAGGYYP